MSVVKKVLRFITYYGMRVVPLKSLSNKVHSCYYSSLDNLYNNCSPLFTAITWHLETTSATPVPAVLPFGE
jgi:hypothetical protein